MESSLGVHKRQKWSAQDYIIIRASNHASTLCVSLWNSKLSKQGITSIVSFWESLLTISELEKDDLGGATMTTPSGLTRTGQTRVNTRGCVATPCGEVARTW